MKIPIIRQLYQQNSPEKLQAAADVLESFSAARGVSQEETDLAGELITNILGAIEVHLMVSKGAKEADALNAFSKKVLGSIDR